MEVTVEVKKVRGGVQDLVVEVDVDKRRYSGGCRFVTTSRKVVDVDLEVLRELVRRLEVIINDIEKGGS
jgi:hypothetical protein